MLIIRREKNNRDKHSPLEGRYANQVWNRISKKIIQLEGIIACNSGKTTQKNHTLKIDNWKCCIQQSIKDSYWERSINCQIKQSNINKKIIVDKSHQREKLINWQAKGKILENVQFLNIKPTKEFRWSRLSF